MAATVIIALVAWAVINGAVAVWAILGWADCNLDRCKADVARREAQVTAAQRKAHADQAEHAMGQMAYSCATTQADLLRARRQLAVVEAENLRLRLAGDNPGRRLAAYRRTPADRLTHDPLMQEARKRA